VTCGSKSHKDTIGGTDFAEQQNLQKQMKNIQHTPFET
jgi:hypothetical protein